MQLGFANRVAKPSIRNRKNNYGREEEGEGGGKEKKKKENCSVAKKRSSINTT